MKIIPPGKGIIKPPPAVATRIPRSLVGAAGGMVYNTGMCGRFTLRAPASVVAEQFALFELPPFTPRFNIAPSQPVPVVRLAPGKGDSHLLCEAPFGPFRQDVAVTFSGRELVWLRWGLIPSWAKDPAIGNRLINARAETAAEKPAFRAALRRRRCLVAADGFYEWQRTGKRKQPYFIRMRDDRPFAFAGLWESWEGPDCSQIESCTLLTTEANELMRPIHDRMPVILPAQHYEQWLDRTVEKPEQLLPLFRAYPAGEMTAEPVSTFVNSPANEGPECIEPGEQWL
jgi:putative SOS response-associated peptidase YedK